MNIWKRENHPVLIVTIRIVELKTTDPDISKLGITGGETVLLPEEIVMIVTL
jgi:hypothetical protein